MVYTFSWVLILMKLTACVALLVLCGVSPGATDSVSSYHMSCHGVSHIESVGVIRWAPRENASICCMTRARTDSTRSTEFSERPCEVAVWGALRRVMDFAESSSAIHILDDYKA